MDFWQYKENRIYFIILSVLAACLVGYILAISPMHAFGTFLLLGVGLPAAYLLLKNQHLGLALVILSVVPGNLIRFSLGTQETGGAAILICDMFIPILILSWVMRKLTTDRDVQYNGINLPLLSFTLIALASLIQGFGVLESTGELTLKEAIVSSMYWFRWVEYAFLFFIAADIIDSEKAVENYLRLLLWTAVLVAIGGFIQLIVMPDFTEYAILYGWDPHQNRLLGTFFDPNFMGGFLAMVESIAIALLLEARTLKERSVLIFQLLVIGIALVLTFSRSGYLAIMVAVFVIGVLRAPKILGASFLVVVLTLSLSPRALSRVVEGMTFDETVVKRFESWGKALELIPNWPVLGVGYNTLMFVQDDLGTADSFDVNNKSGVENSFLSILLTTGVLGLVSFTFIYLAIFKQAFLNWKNKALGKRYQTLSIGIMASLLGIIANSMIINSLVYPFILIYIWVLAGIVVAIPKILNDEF